ncbi:MAG: hypothetical protein ACE5HK_00340 [Candidatus Methylomirabilales bacterium]
MCTRSILVGAAAAILLRAAVAGAADPGELKIQGDVALALDAAAINDVLLNPGAGVEQVKIQDVTVDPVTIDVTNIAPDLREVKIEGIFEGRPFEIKRERGEVEFEGVDLTPEQIQAHLTQPGVEQLKIQDVVVDPTGIDITMVGPDLREVKIEGVTPAGMPFEIQRERGEVKVEGVDLAPAQIQAILAQPDIEQVKIEDVAVNPADIIGLPAGLREVKIEGTFEGRPFEVKRERDQLKIEGVTTNPDELLRDLPAGLREVKIEGTFEGRPFEIKVEDGVVRREFGHDGRHGDRGPHRGEEAEGRGRGKGRGDTSREISRGHSRGKDLDHSIRGRDRSKIERLRHKKVERLEKMERRSRDRHERSGRIERHHRDRHHRHERRGRD